MYTSPALEAKGYTWRIVIDGQNNTWRAQYFDYGLWRDQTTWPYYRADDPLGFGLPVAVVTAAFDLWLAHANEKPTFRGQLGQGAV